MTYRPGRINKEVSKTQTKRESAYGPAHQKEGPEEWFVLQAKPTYKMKIDVKKEGVQATLKNKTSHQRDRIGLHLIDSRFPCKALGLGVYISRGLGTS